MGSGWIFHYLVRSFSPSLASDLLTIFSLGSWFGCPLLSLFSLSLTLLFHSISFILCLFLFLFLCILAFCHALGMRFVWHGVTLYMCWLPSSRLLLLPNCLLPAWPPSYYFPTVPTFFLACSSTTPHTHLAPWVLWRWGWVGGGPGSGQAGGQGPGHVLPHTHTPPSHFFLPATTPTTTTFPIHPLPAFPTHTLYHHTHTHTTRLPALPCLHTRVVGAPPLPVFGCRCLHACMAAACLHTLCLHACTHTHRTPPPHCVLILLLLPLYNITIICIMYYYGKKKRLPSSVKSPSVYICMLFLPLLFFFLYICMYGNLSYYSCLLSPSLLFYENTAGSCIILYIIISLVYIT